MNKPYIIFLREGGVIVKYIYKINGEERMPTEEERKKLYSTFVQALGYRPVKRKKMERSERDAP